MKSNFKNKHFSLTLFLVFNFCLLLPLGLKSAVNIHHLAPEKNHDQEILELRNLIITNVDEARKKIDEKILESQIYENKNIWLDYVILKIDLYRFIGDFTHMKMELFNALRSVNSKTKPEQKLLLDYYKAINYAVNKNQKKHISYIKKTLKAAQKIHFKYLEATCLSTFVKYYFDHKNFKKGREYIVKAKKIFKEINDYNSLLIVDIREGIGYFWEGQDQKAISKFQQCLQYCIKNKLEINKYYLYVNLGETYLFMNEMDSSKYYYNEFLKHKKQADIRDVYQTYMGLEIYYNKIHNIDSAYHYSTLTHEIEDSIRAIADKNLADELEKAFENEQNASIIRNKDEVIKSVKNSNRLILTFLIIGSILLLFIIAMILYAYRTKNKLNKVLVEQQKSIIEKNELIDAALKEKVILLKEIHHRVKNNLQIISSLLNLQSRNVDDPNALNVLAEGKERIQAIALIHQKLYQADSFASIDMESYIIDLTQQLLRTYISNEKKINLTIDSPNINLNLDTAVPVGLIICELVTNAFKHAFNNKTEGNLIVRLYQLSDPSNFILEVKDDGSGFNAKAKKIGLGSEIVESLAEQLDGELSTYSSEEGTLIKIFFKQVES
ncbi:MAG: sensor histidine kinase [Flavobacteriia bacterium]|nr:sensor histidine kinase [Flavobacteriia bacterium]